jgi:hypothetical protein
VSRDPVSAHSRHCLGYRSISPTDAGCTSTIHLEFAVERPREGCWM